MKHIHQSVINGCRFNHISHLVLKEHLNKATNTDVRLSCVNGIYLLTCDMLQLV